MKDYKTGKIYCRCSNTMRIGKRIKIYQNTPRRKRCPNCGKNLMIQIIEKKPIKQKVLVR